MTDDLSDDLSAASPAREVWHTSQAAPHTTHFTGSAPCEIRKPGAVRATRASNSPDTQYTAGARGHFLDLAGPSFFITLAVTDEGAAVFLYLARR